MLQSYYYCHNYMVFRCGGTFEGNISWYLLYVSYFHCITVESVNTSVENSRDPPFYVGTSLNLTCKVDLPTTVDPKIIRNIELVKNPNNNYYYYYPYSDKINIYFHPLRMHHSGTYQCRVCLVISDARSSATCVVGNETYYDISGK